MNTNKPFDHSDVEMIIKMRSLYDQCKARDRSFILVLINELKLNELEAYKVYKFVKDDDRMNAITSLSINDVVDALNNADK